MIGQKVSATLWHVHYRYRNVDPPLIQLSDRDKAPEHIGGEVRVLTADPTGSDLCEVAAMVVLGSKLKPSHEFRLEATARCCDVQGLASLAGKAES